MSQDDSRRWGVVWIVGASSGIGRELARTIAGHARTVAITARRADRLEELSGEVRNIRPFPADVCDEEAIGLCVRTIEETHGPIDLCVYCAARWKIIDSAEFDTDAIRRGMETNYMGVVHALGALIAPMRDRRSGHIAIVASAAGYRGLPKSAAYGPTKAALINLAETLRLELAPHGIDLSLINPGFVDTPMTRDNPFPMPAMISAERAAQRMLEGLLRRRYEIIFPRRFLYLMKLLRIMPNWLYFRYIRLLVMGRRRSRRST